MMCVYEGEGVSQFMIWPQLSRITQPMYMVNNLVPITQFKVDLVYHSTHLFLQVF